MENKGYLSMGSGLFRVKTMRKAFLMAVIFSLVLTKVVFAADVDTGAMNEVVNMLLGWVQKIGIVVAVFGGIEFGFAYANDNADSKNRALRHMASGFIVAAIASTPSIFGFV